MRTCPKGWTEPSAFDARTCNKCSTIDDDDDNGSTDDDDGDDNGGNGSNDDDFGGNDDGSSGGDDDDDDDFGGSYNSASACDGDVKGSAVTQELGGELNPGESRLLMHARTKILGLEARVCIEMTKTFAVIRMDGSLFGSFLKAYFGVDAYFKKPRSFRLQGGMKMESKTEMLDKIKKKFNDKATESKAKFDKADADLEQAKVDAKAGLTTMQADNDKKKAEWQAAANDLRAKTAVYDAKKKEIQQKKTNVCTIEDCTKIPWRKALKRAACGTRNVVCYGKRALVITWLSIKQAALEVAKFAVTTAGRHPLSNQQSSREH